MPRIGPARHPAGDHLYRAQGAMATIKALREAIGSPDIATQGDLIMAVDDIKDRVAMKDALAKAGRIMVLRLKEGEQGASTSRGAAVPEAPRWEDKDMRRMRERIAQEKEFEQEEREYNVVKEANTHSEEAPNGSWRRAGGTAARSRQPPRVAAGVGGRDR